MAKLTRTKYPGVYTTPNGTYACVVRNVRRTFPTLQEAKNGRAKLMTELVEGPRLKSTQHTVASFYEEWIEWVDVRKPTRDRYRCSFRNQILPHLGHIKLKHLDDIRIEDWLRQLVKNGMERSTAITTLVPLSSMLTRAVKLKLIPLNPAVGIDRPKKTKLDEVKAMTDEQVAAIFEHLPGYHIFYEFLLKTGLRIGEALAIRWMDWEGDHLVVRRAWSASTLNPPKNGKQRTVRVSNNLSAALTAWKLETKFGAPEDLIWPSARGKFQDDALLGRTYLKPAARAAGAPWVTNHTFRHTFATQANRNGMPIVLLSEMLGHHSAAFTLSRYVTLFKSDVVGIDMSWQDGPVLSNSCPESEMLLNHAV
jgi:integrase